MTKFNSLEELYNEFPWRTASKFIPLAKRYGFTDESEIKKFLNNKAPHDKIIDNSDKMLPIYSNTKGEYHFDTMFSKHSPPFLVFININTRKAYAYQMKNKGAIEVHKAFDKFFDDVHDVKILRSDQDTAYLSNDVIDYLKDKHIIYRTTEDNNHNILGIINRFMRTLRDLNNKHNFSNQRMQDILNEYNNSPHRSLKGKSPNDMKDIDETAYIDEKDEETKNIKQSIDLDIGDRVRVILDKNKIEKNRSNLSDYSYIIDSKDGNNFVVKSADGSVDKYPAYRLVKCDSRYELADTIKNGKRGMISDILDYNEKNDTYKVEFDEGTIDTIPAKNLREGNPLVISQIEREYWVDRVTEDNVKIPIKIRKFMN